MDQQPLSITSKQQLEEFGQLSTMPMVVFTKEKILYANEWFLQSIEETKLDPVFHNIYSSLIIEPKNGRQEISITNKQGKVILFDCFCNKTMYQNQPAFFSILYNASERTQHKQEMQQISKLRQLIIDISQSILDDSDLHDYFDFVLTKALQATDKAQLGTILILEDGVFHFGASYGYNENIKDFTIPVEESFSYQRTNGAFDRIVNVTDATGLPFYIPVKTNYGDEIFIKSSLSAPIHVQGKFYGMVNLDAIEKNAFQEEDIQSLEYIRNSIEIAITNRLLYEEKAYLSQYDQVTNLHNRYFFEKHSEYVIKKAMRYNEVFHLVMIDIDDLKHINDSYGHIVGDMHIHEVAQTIKKNIRESDVFVRYGGDEFVGLLFNASIEDTKRIFSAIKSSLAQSPIKYEEQLIALSISYGIASFPVDGLTINELINTADDRMYNFKVTTKKAMD
jgi:diguanylate cyclase (GGDEF)-like protein